MSKVAVINSFAQGHKTEELSLLLLNLMPPRRLCTYLHLIKNCEKQDLPLSSHQGATTTDPFRFVLRAFCALHALTSAILIIDEASGKYI